MYTILSTVYIQTGLFGQIYSYICCYVFFSDRRTFSLLNKFWIWGQLILCKTFTRVIEKRKKENKNKMALEPRGINQREILTHSQRSALSVCPQGPRGPRGCARGKAPKASSFFVQFKDAYISIFQCSNLH